MRGTTPQSYGRPISHLAQEAIARVQMYNKKVPANSPVITLFKRNPMAAAEKSLYKKKKIKKTVET